MSEQLRGQMDPERGASLSRVMGGVTLIVLCVFGFYLVQGMLGLIKVNFSLILLIAVLITGTYWIADHFYFMRLRRREAENALAEFDQRRTELAQRYASSELDDSRAGLARSHLQQPWWLEYTASFFPVILAIFLIRSFVVEPFRIPSGSMMPTLLIGDFILVNKYTYGVRLPVVNTKVFPINEPQRGDVMVFRYPKDESLDYIKRVVGVPGDTIRYENKRMTVNGQPLEYVQMQDYLDEERLAYANQLSENLSGVPHLILNAPDRPAQILGADDYPFRENCNYNQSGMVCKVPDGHYFVMGDNRDNSADSRFWGFVPERNIVGKAFFVWMNLGNPGRIGGFK